MRGAAPRRMKIDDLSGLGTHKGYPYIGGIWVGAARCGRPRGDFCVVGWPSSSPCPPPSPNERARTEVWFPNGGCFVGCFARRGKSLLQGIF